VNYRDFIRREAAGVCMRGKYSAEDAYLDDLYWEEEARRNIKLRRRTDAADGFIQPGEGEDDENL
jgi:hypothetical protein